MGIESYRGIDRVSKKAKDFNKKQASGKGSDADQAKILTVSARLSEAKSKLQNARSQSQGQGLVYLDNPTQTAKKENSDAQIKVAPPKAATREQSQQKDEILKAQIINYKAETISDIESLEASKAEIQAKIDGAILNNSGADIQGLRDEYSIYNDASKTSKEHQKFLDTDKLATKDPELLQKIQNKKNEILALSFDKTKKPELANAKQELDQLKSQIYS